MLVFTDCCHGSGAGSLVPHQLVGVACRAWGAQRSGQMSGSKAHYSSNSLQASDLPKYPDESMCFVGRSSGFGEGKTFLRIRGFKLGVLGLQTSGPCGLHVSLGRP